MERFLLGQMECPLALIFCERSHDRRAAGWKRSCKGDGGVTGQLIC